MPGIKKKWKANHSARLYVELRARSSLGQRRLPGKLAAEDPVILLLGVHLHVGSELDSFLCYLLFILYQLFQRFQDQTERTS